MISRTRAPVGDASIAACLAVAVLVILSALLHGCAHAQDTQAQIRVLNIATKAANEAEQGIVLAYRFRLQRCLEDSVTRLDFDVCAAEVEHTYARVRLAWDTLRRTQDEYATALERGKYGADEFRLWFSKEYCHLVAELPADVRLPEVPGLSCEDPQ